MRVIGRRRPSQGARLSNQPTIVRSDPHVGVEQNMAAVIQQVREGERRSVREAEGVVALDGVGDCSRRAVQEAHTLLCGEYGVSVVANPFFLVTWKDE